MEGREQRCLRCQSPCSVGHFKKVACLQNTASGLQIYVHLDPESTEQTSQTRKSKGESFILHNESDKDLKRPDYIKEISQYRTKCKHCRTIMQRVQNLLNEMKDLKRNQVIGVCEHCNRFNLTGKCKRCEYLIDNFKYCKAKKQQDEGERLKSCFCKVNELLQSVLECHKICMDRLCQGSTPMSELDKLLSELKSTLSVRQPEISCFPEIGFGQLIPLDSEEVLDQLLGKIKCCVMERSSDESIRKEASIDNLQQKMPPSSEVKPVKATKSREKEILKSKQKNKQTIVDHSKKTKQKVKSKKDTIKTLITVQESLPQLKKRETVTEKDDDSGFEIDSREELQLAHCRTEEKDMIKGTAIVPKDVNFGNESSDVIPILRNATRVYHSLSTTSTRKIEEIIEVESLDYEKPKRDTDKKTGGKNYAFQYKLSDRNFIDNGWTILPTFKVLRKINVYKMVPAAPQFNWFEHHKNRMMFYDTGEKLAEVGDNGCGKLFYKNGMLALDFYNAKELYAGKRYVVYSFAENGKITMPTVLASFDFLGNGVVYDCFGNERMKYSQTEGIVLDKKVGPPTHWLWHSLNDPPVIKTVLVDTYVKGSNPCLEEILKSQETDDTEELDAEMRAIELACSIKEKADSLRRKYIPFQIRMKALKINDQFSLRVMNQSNIYLLFRDGQTAFKINLGMNLVSTEIVDTQIVEMSDVVTHYDQLPPKSRSMAEIQGTLQQTRKLQKLRTEREQRIRQTK